MHTEAATQWLLEGEGGLTPLFLIIVDYNFTKRGGGKVYPLFFFFGSSHKSHWLIPLVSVVSYQQRLSFPSFTKWLFFF